MIDAVATGVKLRLLLTDSFVSFVLVIYEEQQTLLGCSPTWDDSSVIATGSSRAFLEGES